MDVLKSIWNGIQRLFKKVAPVKQEPIGLTQFKDTQSSDYTLFEFEKLDTVVEETRKEATNGQLSSVTVAPKPIIRVVPSPPSVEELPPKVQLRLVKPRIQPRVDEVIAYGRSRTNLLEEALLAKLIADDLVFVPAYLAKPQDYSFHTRWVTSNNPISAPERFKNVSLIEQWAILNRQGIADEVVWRFNPGQGMVHLAKLDAYRGQAGWMELLEVTVHLQADSTPSQHAFLIAYTDDGEVLGHPFMNSIALLPAETRPITLSQWVQPNMEAERAQLVESYLKSRFWDERMSDLDGWRQRANEKLRVALNKAKYKKLLYTPDELASWKDECHAAFLNETEAIDNLHEWLLSQMEDFSSLRYQYETLVSLRWELV